MSSPSQAVPPLLADQKQKLVTIYLDNSAYMAGKTIVGSFGDKHGLVEEHLASFLADGWRVKKIHGFGGNSDSLSVRAGWPSFWKGINVLIVVHAPQRSG